MSEGCFKCKCYDCRREYGRLTEVELKAEAEEHVAQRWTPASSPVEQYMRDMHRLNVEMHMHFVLTQAKTLQGPFTFPGGDLDKGWTRK